MLFQEIGVRGAMLVEPEPRFDQRGLFARVWCEQEWAAKGLTAHIAQVSISFNAIKGTLRGMHFQSHPAREAKLVGCTRGAIYDVVLDLRQDSPTYLQWASVELTAENRRRLYVPEGCAHGFQSLEDASELLYLISHPYSPEHARGVRYNDPTFAIKWPLPVTMISDADRTWPDYASLPLIGLDRAMGE